MNAWQIPTPEAGDNPTSGHEILSQKLAFASPAAAVTATVTGGPAGRVHPDRTAEEPRSQPARAAADVSQQQPFPSFKRRYISMASASGPSVDQPRPLPEAHFVPRILREAGMVVTPAVTRASGSHLEPVGQNDLEDDPKIPSFLRRHGVGAAHAQPIASDWEASKCPQADQSGGFLPSILRGFVTFPATPSRAPASASPAVTLAPAAGSICPTCRCRIPARLSAAERQRAYRKRKREKAKLVVPYPGGVPVTQRFLNGSRFGQA
jgi:hypothetical protein